MPERKVDRVLLIDQDGIAGKEAEELLVEAGYEVRLVNSPYAAIAALEGAGKAPFSVVISNFELTRMSGDDLLEHARYIAPDTQRIIVTESVRLSSLIDAVNGPSIDGLIISPFESSDFLSEVGKHCEKFRKIQQRESLRKLIEHQNRQKLGIIQNIKKRKALFGKLLNERKKELFRFISGEKTAPYLKTAGDSVSDGVVAIFRKLAGELRQFLNSEIIKGSAVATEFDPEEIAGILERHLSNSPAGDPDIDDNSADPDYRKATGSFPYIGEGKDEIDEKLIDEILSLFFLKRSSDIGFGSVDDKSSSSSDDNLYGSEVEEKLQSSDPAMESGAGGLSSISDTKNRLHDGKNRTGYDSTGHTDIAEIRYYFDTGNRVSRARNFTRKSAGKSLKVSDRSEGFVDSGKVSVVSIDTLLAEKIRVKKESNSSNTDKISISTTCDREPLFNAGTNTRLSDDGLKIYATADGKPHVDIMGTVSVFKDMTIQGDADADTGNVNFNGNIVVKGVVKRGFRVKCANLRVEAVEGAEISITGNLDVLGGIIDSDSVNVQGSIMSGFVNNSRIKALGDIFVKKEIIDSELFAGGVCNNRTGLIISSFINARSGVVAGEIGTEKSDSSRFEVGTDGIVEIMVADLEDRIEKIHFDIRSLLEEISVLESEEQQLHGKISGAAFIQDRALMELRAIEKQLPKIEESEDILELKRVFKAVKSLKAKADASEKIILDSFERQDSIVESIQAKQRSIDSLETRIKGIRTKVLGLKDFASGIMPRAEVKVFGRAMAGTHISGTGSKLMLSADESACLIHEVPSSGRKGAKIISSMKSLFRIVVTPLEPSLNS